MTRRGVVAVLAIVGVVAIIGTGAVVAGIGLWPIGAGGPFGEEPHPPALLSSSRLAPTVPMISLRTVRRRSPAAVQTPRLRTPGTSRCRARRTRSAARRSSGRTNRRTFSRYPSRTRTKAPPCPGVARYEATMRIPAGDDPWRIVVNHDNETVTTIEGDSRVGSRAGRRALASQSPTSTQIRPKREREGSSIDSTAQYSGFRTRRHGTGNQQAQSHFFTPEE